MGSSEMICSKCGGNSLVQATDFIPLRPLDKKFGFGTEKIYRVCLDCGEVVSIRVKDPKKLKENQNS